MPCLAGIVACALQFAAADTGVARAPLPPDRWLGPDKLQHGFVAGFAYAGSFAIARMAGADRHGALAIAVGPTAIIAIGKEVRDRHAYGRFSFRDLVADAIGAAAYAALMSRTMR